MVTESTVPLVLNTLLRPFIHELTRRGIPHSPLLEGCGIQSNNLLVGEHYVSVRSSYDFVEACAKICGDPYFAFNLGTTTPLESLANFEFIDQARGSLGDLLSALILDARRVNSSAKYTITNDGEWVKVVGKRVFRPRSVPGQVDAYYSAYMRNAFRIYAGRRWSPELLTIWVSDPSAIPTSQLEGTIVLKGDRTGADFRFPSTWMLQSAQEIVERVELTRREAKERFVADFRTMLLGQLSDPKLSISSAADDLSTSASTLRRELRQHNTTFTSLLAEVRAERAQNMLLETDLSVAEIALAVGYSDASSFARAFRNWVGETPRDFRQRKYV